MRTSTLLDTLRDARIRAADGSSREAVLDRWVHAASILHDQECGAETPERTRLKITTFLDHLDAAADGLGERITQPTYLLNVVGEAMVRADLVHGAVVEFMQVGLYFFGLEQVERRWPARAAVYLAIHAEHLSEFVGRSSLKQLLSDGRDRMAEGRPFCVTYSYLNSLRRAYWQRCRKSEDAMDRALTGEPVASARSEELVEAKAPASAPTSDRVALMLEIFRTQLSDQQRWIYLAKNRAALHREVEAGPVEACAEFSIEALLRDLSQPAPAGDLGWSEVAERLGINEKTAKREYLRTLHVLLHESCLAVFPDGRIPSNYVRRVLDLIRSVVYEKDLRIKSRTGRGMGALVEKWEVALRFVLNHEMVSASS